MQQLLFFLLALLPLVYAQFGFFEQMFHPGHQQQQQQQQQFGANAWLAHSQAVQCSSYLCPKTLDCVKKPSDCPCPYPEDIKCVVPDAQPGGESSATVFCVSGESECGEVERLAIR